MNQEKKQIGYLSTTGFSLTPGDVQKTNELDESKKPTLDTNVQVTDSSYALPTLNRSQRRQIDRHNQQLAIECGKYMNAYFMYVEKEMDPQKTTAHLSKLNVKWKDWVRNLSFMKMQTKERKQAVDNMFLNEVNKVISQIVQQAKNK